MKIIEVNFPLSDIVLTPFCIGGLISIDFSLKVEINYKENISASYFELPIQFIDKRSLKFDIYKSNFNNNIQSEQNENKISNINNNNIQNENNKIYYNINSFDEDDIIKNIEQSDDFVIFNHEDFQKLFFESKNK